MYEVSVRRHFDAAHYLRGYGGKCEEMHGHRFEVVVCAQTEGLNEIGLSVDFREMKDALDGLLRRFDHVCLNDVPPFDSINPSSENLATEIYGGLASRLGEVRISRVEVWESPDSMAAYIP
jgi:6-pyruvoyltetrahydropterin/6-carboxytetrahydropterin synthase